MTVATTSMAKSITFNGSKQTYYTARLMVDKDLVDDFFRAYAYFRWADDIIDVSSISQEERIAFIKRQRELIDGLYQNQSIEMLSPEEEILAELIQNDRQKNSGLQSFIRNMFAIIEFDANRKGQLISLDELKWYSERLSQSVTDGLQYFIGNGHPYPKSANRYWAAIGAHIAHLLRDTMQDIADGFINIPHEYLEAHGITPEDVTHPAFRAWVKERVDQARRYFEEGQKYFNRLNVLRCKIVGYWYSARFMCVLDAIERDDYVLRETYNERRRLPSWLKIAWLGISLTLKHAALRHPHKPEIDSP
jgi:phytoene/squalene synthetase